MQNSIAILIPAYNPDKHLVELVASFSKHGFSDIVIVDDGSDSIGVFDEASMTAPIHVLRHSKNQGKGAALKTGFTFCGYM